MNLEKKIIDSEDDFSQSNLNNIEKLICERKQLTWCGWPMYLNTLNRYFYTFSKMLSFSSIRDYISKANIHVIEIECKIIKYNVNNIFCALSISNKHIFNDFSIDTLSLFFSLFCLSAICLPLKYITTNEWIQMQVLLFYLFVLFKIQIAVTHYMEVFSLFTCVLWKNKQKLKNKTCIYYHNYYDIVFINLFPKKHNMFIYTLWIILFYL